MQVKITKTCRVNGTEYKKGSVADLENFNSHCMEMLKTKEVAEPQNKTRKKTKKSKNN